MRWKQELRFITRRLIHRRCAERELDEEIRAHLEMEIERNIADGMSPEEARLAALRSFGSVAIAKEDSRAMWGLRSLEILWQDLRYGLRTLLKRPGFTAIAIITLALGIGANTAMFSVVFAALLRQLPYEDADRLVILYETNQQLERDEINVSYPNFVDWRAQNLSFERLAACLYGGMVLTGKDEPAQLQTMAVSADLFEMLRVKPLRGRVFRQEEDKAGGAPVVVVSHGFWQNRFGGDEGLIGRQITLDGKSRTVIGVMPPNFALPPGDQTEVWMAIGPLADQMRQLQNRGVHMLTAIGRLKPSVTIQQAQTEMATIANRIQQQNPAADTGHGINIVSGYDSLTKNARPALLALLVAVGFLLLIACANVANWQRQFDH
jgi:predicted permease